MDEYVASGQLNVTFRLNGEDPKQLEEKISKAFQRLVAEGGITGGTDAEIISFSVNFSEPK